MQHEALGGGVAEFDAAIEAQACPYLNQLGEAALGEMRGVYEQLDAGNFDAIGELASKIAAASKPQIAAPGIAPTAERPNKSPVTKREVSNEQVAHAEIAHSKITEEPLVQAMIESDPKVTEYTETTPTETPNTEEQPRKKTSDKTTLKQENNTKTLPATNKSPVNRTSPNKSNQPVRPTDQSSKRLISQQHKVAIDEQKWIQEVVINAERKLEPPLTEPASKSEVYQSAVEPAKLPDEKPIVSTENEYLKPTEKPPEALPSNSDLDFTEVPDLKLPMAVIYKPSKEELSPRPHSVNAETNQKQESQITKISHVLDDFSEQFHNFKPEAIEPLVEPISEILLNTEQFFGQSDEELLESGEAWATVAAEIEVLFEQEQVELSDEEFTVFIESLQELNDDESELTESNAKQIKFTKVDTSELQSTEELIYETLPEESLKIFEQIQETIEVMDSESFNSAAKPMMEAICAVQEIRLDHTADPKSINQAEENVLVATCELFDQLQIEIPQTEIQQIVKIISNSQIQNLLKEDNDISKLFSELGTYEGRRFKSALQKIQIPIHNILGKIILRRFNVTSGVNKQLTAAA